MARANFIFVFVGIETPDPVLLKAAKKHHNATAEPLERLGTIREHGIHIVASFLMGFDGETRSVFDRQLAFTEASGIGVMIPCLMQAVPNTQLSRRMADEGRLLPKQDVAMNITLEGLELCPQGRTYKEGVPSVLFPAYRADLRPRSVLRKDRARPRLALRRKVLPRRQADAIWAAGPPLLGNGMPSRLGSQAFLAAPSDGSAPQPPRTGIALLRLCAFLSSLSPSVICPRGHRELP